MARADARCAQARLPLGDSASDWHAELQASLARHRQRRARLAGTAALGPAADAVAENVVPFRRRAAARRIPIVAREASVAAALASEPELALPPAAAAPAPQPSHARVPAPASPPPEPLAEPVVPALPLHVSPAACVTLPLPFAALEAEVGHVAIAAPAPPPLTDDPLAAAGLAVSPASPRCRWTAGLEDAAWALLLAACCAAAAWLALGAPSPPHLGRGALRLAAALLVALPAFWFWLLARLALAWGDATPGLRRCRLRLVAFDGRPADRSMRLRRVWASALSLGALGLGYLWMFLDPDHLTWHDHLSRTVVAPSLSASPASGRSSARNRAR